MNYKDFFESQRSVCSLPKWEGLPDIELYMDQVITLMTKYFGGLSANGEPLLTPSMINNYVKNEIIPAPVKKKYSRTHLFRLIIICVMKPVLPIPDIGRLIETLLKTKSEAEVMDIFAEQYESEYRSNIGVIESAVEQRFGETAADDEALCLSIMHAAAISSGSKRYAENTLAELNKQPSPSAEKPKKEKKKKPAKPEE